MQLHGRRRVRSGYTGSEHPPDPVIVKPPPEPPKTGKGVIWRDHDVQRKRGHASYLDLELSACQSTLVQDGKTGKIDEGEELWYLDADYEDARRMVKNDFFRRLGDKEEAEKEKVDPNWNRLTAYSGHLKKFKPRSYEAGDNSSDEGNNTPQTMSRSNSSNDMMTEEARARQEQFSPASRGATPSPLPYSLGDYGGADTPSFRRKMEDQGSFRRKWSGLDTPVGLDHFTVHGLVGEGAFGKVMMATKIDTQKVYAMKVIRKAMLFSDATRVSQAITEKQVLQQMAAKPHPYVISLRYAFQTEDNIFLVMDLVGGGDMFQLLEAKGRLPEAWVIVYAAEVALALEHVHAHGVLFRDLKVCDLPHLPPSPISPHLPSPTAFTHLHVVTSRDLKPENVMIGVDGHLKLTDFGLSKQLEETSGVDRDPAKRATTKTICGTPEYIAPEVLQGKPYHQAIDWWTYGCLVYEMVHGQVRLLPPHRLVSVRSMASSLLSHLSTRACVRVNAPPVHRRPPSAPSTWARS